MMVPWKSDSLDISIGYPRISKDCITTCARRAHSKPAKIAHACTAIDLAVHTARTRNGDRRKTEIGKLAAELRGLTFFDDLPEVRRQLAIVTGKHLIQVPLGPDGRLQSPLFTLGGFGFVLLCFRFKISHDGATPRNTRTTFDSTLACVEKKATRREIFAAYADPRASSATLGLPPTRERELTGNKGTCLLAIWKSGQAGTEDAMRARTVCCAAHTPKEALMRFPALAILTVATVLTAAPARAQTYDPAYPVCLHVYGRGAAITNAATHRCLSATRRHRAAPPSASSIHILPARKCPLIIGGIAASSKAALAV
jgi:hypothetical protein